MSAILKIDDADFEPALLSCEDIMQMTKSGVLTEGRGYELIEGVLVKMATKQGPHVEAGSELLRFFFSFVGRETHVSSGPAYT